MSNRNQGTMCYLCRGTGKEDTIGEETCGHCAGTGRDKNSDLWSEPCGRCNGRGKVTYARKITCRNCHGTGKTSY